MLKEFMQFILEKTRAEVLEIDGKKYTTQGVRPVKDAEPETLKLATLTGLVDYIKSNVDELSLDKLIVHVEDHASVRLYSALHGCFAQRDCLLHIEASLLQMKFNTFIDNEPFNIFMQSCFQPTADREAVMRCAGTVVDAAVRTSNDDGVTQEVTTRQGIQRREDQKVPSPVLLKPFRTFVEVEQPESAFVFRMRSGDPVECMLVEADGGAWKNTARQNIKDYLTKELPEGVVVIA